MTTEQLIRILITTTLVEMMAAIGMGVRLEDLSRIGRSPGLVIRAAIANYVGVPLVTVGLLLWLGPAPMISAGFLIVAVCPGAAYGPPFTSIARGNVATAVGLMVILAASSTICAPLLLRFLLPLMTESRTVRVDLLRMVVMLLLSQLLPLFTGLSVRHYRPALADRLEHPADMVSTALNLCVLGLIVVIRFPMLAAIRLAAFMGMLALVAASIGTGWLLGEAGSENRKAMTITTSVRNVAVALVIATASFPATPAVTAVLVYGLFQTLLMAAVALLWGRLWTLANSAGSEAVHVQGR
ncbi:MAG: bile acid:sodium symporter [Deltaproteobacteria bacterium]|jgi:bile acid:Na+ symporter, BASS family|nr:bile acid:sodium symporter [Deltaproteobacteria bacterium]